jgi:hypothetical protein
MSGCWSRLTRKRSIGRTCDASRTSAEASPTSPDGSAGSALRFAMSRVPFRPARWRRGFMLPAITLRVSGLEESVDVVGSPPTVDTSSASTGGPGLRSRCPTTSPTGCRASTRVRVRRRRGKRDCASTRSVKMTASRCIALIQCARAAFPQLSEKPRRSHFGHREPTLQLRRHAGTDQTKGGRL